jgi:hypothetical protein
MVLDFGCSIVRHVDILAQFKELIDVHVLAEFHEVLHVQERLREVRRPRRQKLQSSMD